MPCKLLLFSKPYPTKNNHTHKNPGHRFLLYAAVPSHENEQEEKKKRSTLNLTYNPSSQAEERRKKKPYRK